MQTPTSAKLTPKMFLTWVFVISAAFSAALLLCFLGLAALDSQRREFPYLLAFLDNRYPFITAFSMASGAAVITTFVVFLLGATRGDLHLKVLGLELSGPSGALTLWCCVFLAIIAAFSALLR